MTAQHTFKVESLSIAEGAEMHDPDRLVKLLEEHDIDGWEFAGSIGDLLIFKQKLGGFATGKIEPKHTAA